jgi:formylglycine-generating enzyme required for sulfatase activity
MVRIPAGVLHGKTIKAFYMDKTHVTVAQFREFVKATGYVTEAERAGMAETRSLATWEHVPSPGASWRFPEGRKRPAARDDEPVVQVSYADARAYAAWRGVRLPTAIEFEWAQRGGLVGKLYAWGDEEMPDGKPMANYWHGPLITGKPRPENLIDPYLKVAPVGKFPPNGYGLLDMSGNAWQITSTKMGQDHVAVMGGSWRCATTDKFVECCLGFMNGIRQPLPIGTRKLYGAVGDNVGFRCVKDILVARVVH